MEFFAADLGLLADVSSFQLLPPRRITKHQRFAAGDCVDANPPQTRAAMVGG